MLHMREGLRYFTTSTMAGDDISVTQWRDAETLRMALEAAGMGLWSWDAISDVVIWDDQTCRVFGREQGTGPANYSDYLTALHPEDRALVRESVTEALRTGVYRDIEHRITRPDGTVRWILGKGALLRSPDGTLLKIIGGVVDITEQVEAEHAGQSKAEQSLRESEERLRLLGDNLPDSAVYQYVDELGVPERYTCFSAGIERLNGITVEGVLRDRSTLHDQILPEHIARFRETKSRSKRSLSDFDIEVPMRRPDGEIRWIHFHSRPRRLPAGRTIWDGVLTDVTARKKGEDALKKQAELLRLSYDAMIVWELDGAIESWNVGAERLYGYSELEAVGKLTRTLLAPRFPKPWGEISSRCEYLGRGKAKCGRRLGTDAKS
jgi:PAS domain S-box-containing protein